MLELKVNDLRADYYGICNLVRMTGARSAPRGLPTLELRDVALVLDSPAAATFPTKINRGLSSAILSAELMQWVAGVSDLKQLNSVSAGRFKQYSDDGTRLYGAYGPRARRGLERAVRVLQKDTGSRQASVSLWRSLESDETSDLPCTLSWSFAIRDGELTMMSVMRSNDVWTGMPYDVPAMARIQSAVAWALNVPAGRYTHVAQSLHLYESDAKKVDALIKSPADLALNDRTRAPLLASTNPVASFVPTERWEWLRDAWALGAVRGYPFIADEFAWYRDHLKKHPGYDYYCESCNYYLPQPELICEAGTA